MDIINQLQQMLSFEFMQRAYLGGIIFAIIAPFIGQFMVFRGYSGISDGISHIALVGITASLIVGSENIFFAIFITLILSLLLEMLNQNKLVKGETAITIFIVLSIAIVSILQQKIGFSRSLENLLFGSITTISSYYLQVLAIVSLVFIFIILLIYNKLLNITFSKELSQMLGIRTWLYNYLLIALTAVIITLGIDIVGGLLVSSLMVIPVASSQQYNLSFKQTHLLSIVFAVSSVLIGITTAWFLDLPSGASIAVSSLVIFALSVFNKIIIKL